MTCIAVGHCRSTSIYQWTRVSQRGCKVRVISAVQCTVPVDISSLSDMLREGKGHKICSYQSECTLHVHVPK